MRFLRTLILLCLIPFALSAHAQRSNDDGVTSEEVAAAVIVRTVNGLIQKHVSACQSVDAANEPLNRLRDEWTQANGRGVLAAAMILGRDDGFVYVGPAELPPIMSAPTDLHGLHAARFKQRCLNAAAGLSRLSSHLMTRDVVGTLDSYLQRTNR